MKALKRLGCVLLAVLLLMSLGAPAFAAGGEDGPGYQVENKEGNIPAGTPVDLYIGTNTAPAQANHKYLAFQIFGGDVYVDAETGTRTLSNVVWGDGINDTGKELLLRGAERATAADAAKSLSTNSDDARALADDLSVKAEGGYKYLTNGKGFEWISEGQKYLLKGVPCGYYLVLDTVNLGTENFSLSNYIVEVLSEQTYVEPKLSFPKLEKEVLDVNDTTGDSLWGHSADYDVGDVIPYRITITLPDNYATYETYTLVIHDLMAPGLTYNENSVRLCAIDAEGNETAFKFISASIDHKEDGSTELQVGFGDLKKTEGAPKLTGGQTLVLTYTATLNENAQFQNENEAWLVYSNDPDSTGSGDNNPGTGTTPRERAVVFTYDATVNKVDGDADNKPLAGAMFELYKQIDGDWKAVDSLELPEGEDAQTSFTFKRLDDGVYKLVESVVPQGYNKCDDIYFEITATHDPVNGVTELTVTQLVLNDKGKLEAYKDGDDALKLTFPANAATGQIETTVANYRGLLLPETGGIGTTIFYVIGGVLVAAALVLLITKKRMSKEG